MLEHNAYTTEKKEEVQKLARDGEVQTYFRIWATSRGGTYFHVDIPEDELAKADQVLAARAKQLDGI